MPLTVLQETTYINQELSNQIIKDYMIYQYPYKKQPFKLLTEQLISLRFRLNREDFVAFPIVLLPIVQRSMNREMGLIQFPPTLLH